MGRKSTRPPSLRATVPSLPRISHSSAPPKVYDEEIEGTETDQTALIAPKSFRTARRPTLMAMAGSNAGNIFRVDKPSMSIGRANTSDIILTDQGVSRLHCVVTRAGDGRYFVEDRGSRNGTIVNGGVVTRAELAAGDRIQLGSEAVLQFGWFDEAEEELAKRMYEGATRDPLTRAFNRRHFYERLASEVSYALRHGEKLAAVLFDIDHFKAINDTHGHQAGDEVLRAVAACLTRCVRPMDTVARHGGEEFAILLPNCRPLYGEKVAERIRRAIEALVIAASPVLDLRITISIGGAFAPEWIRSTCELWLERTDQQLYHAKHGGRNRCAIDLPRQVSVSAEEKGLLFEHFGNEAESAPAVVSQGKS